MDRRRASKRRVDPWALVQRRHSNECGDARARGLGGRSYEIRALEAQMKRSTYWMTCLLAIGTLLVPLETAAQSDRAADDKTLSPYFFVVNGDPAVDRLPLKQTHVNVAVAGVIADVTVRQVYEN